MINDIAAYLHKWLPRHAEENRSYLTVAIGCTGGQHRSVYMVEQLAQALVKRTGAIQLRHRELGLQYTLSELPATVDAASSTPPSDTKSP